MTIPRTTIDVERSSPHSLVSAVRSDVIPFRHVPGLSLGNTQPPADQIGVFVDGDGPTPVTVVGGDPERPPISTTPWRRCPFTSSISLTC